MNENDGRALACSFLVVGSEALLATLGALTALGLLVVAFL